MRRPEKKEKEDAEKKERTSCREYKYDVYDKKRGFALARDDIRFGTFPNK